MRSLRRWLLVTLLGGLLFASALALLLTYATARAELDQLYDESLRQVALSLRDNALLDTERLARSSERAEQRVLVQVDDLGSQRTYLSRQELALPRAAGEGFRTLQHDGRAWRVFALIGRTQEIQVAQPLAERRTQATAAALRILWPLLALLPLLALAIGWIVGRALRPLEAVAHSLRARTPNSLAPLATAGLPGELAPVVHELNALLARLSAAFDEQHRFVADAAHELRTPIAALTLQVQLAERAQDEQDRRAALARLDAGVKRAARLVQQLLTLARLEPDAAARVPGVVDLGALAAAVVDDLRPLAQAKEITLACQAMAGYTVSGEQEALRVLLANLLDNAIRYTPPGGRVEVAVAADGADVRVSVTDDGPGIPIDERERVFDRFYRGSTATAEGSGLGLAIARQVVLAHRGRLQLACAPSGRGLAVSVWLPGVSA